MVQGISVGLDWLREAYIKTHPKGKEDPLFTLDDEENAEAVKWILKRSRKSPRMAQSVRTSTDLYDSYAVPVAILYPRLKRFIAEIREQGVSIRGR